MVDTPGIIRLADGRRRVHHSGQRRWPDQILLYLTSVSIAETLHLTLDRSHFDHQTVLRSRRRSQPARELSVAVTGVAPLKLAQHQEIGAAQVGLQARLFIVAESHAFVAVVRERRKYEDALLAGLAREGLRKQVDQGLVPQFAASLGAGLAPRFLLPPLGQFVDPLAQHRAGQQALLELQAQQRVAVDPLDQRPMGLPARRNEPEADRIDRAAGLEGQRGELLVEARRVGLGGGGD